MQNPNPVIKNYILSSEKYVLNDNSAPKRDFYATQKYICGIISHSKVIWGIKYEKRAKL